MKRCKLGELLRIQHGYAFKSENYVDQSNVALVTLANISSKNDFKFIPEKTTFYGADYPEQFNLNEGDLIMPLTEQVIGLFGNTAFIPKISGIQFVLNQRVGKVVPFEDQVDKYFLHFLLATKLVRDQLEARSSGTKQRNIGPDDVYDITVYVPDLPTQKKIGSLLYRFETIVNNNNKIEYEIDQILKQLYSYWFIQFDFPDKNGNPYKSSGGEMTYSSELKRDIPDGWNIFDFTDNPICGVLKPGVDMFDKKNYLATANIDGTDIEDGEWITFENRENRANMQPKKNSVWFAKMKNSIKHLTITEDDEWITEKYILSTGFVGLDVKKDALGYLHCYIDHPLFEFIKNRLAHGATQEAVNNEDLSSIQLIVPPDAILKKFNDLVLPLLIQSNKCRKENQELIKIRNYFMPLLLNGQTKIGD